MEKNTSNKLRPITIAKPEAAMGSPCPICPYALPAKEAAIPRIANVVASPKANASESPTTWSEQKIAPDVNFDYDSWKIKDDCKLGVGW